MGFNSAMFILGLKALEPGPGTAGLATGLFLFGGGIPIIGKAIDYVVRARHRGRR